MNKNLKKVISAVAALSVSASSMAVFAADFSDVDATASYAQAVNELSALGVINGYEDGTFGPDKLVTRAEITKMIVDALGEGSQAASGSGINTQFTDVTGAHWAAGYVSTGVADGFIAGMGDGTFAPDDNVTYVQAQKMLVSAIGYETYAQGAGGWPSGYKTWAATRGITKGVSANDNDQLTRAQVAQMIDNAMDAPVCVISKYEPDVWGNPQPVLEIKDGEGKDYQTLFTKKHDAYKVYGRVTATSKTSSSVETGMVTFQVEKADNFDDEYIKNDTVTEDMYIGDSKADEYLRTYSQALVQKDDDDEYTIISITPAASNKTVELSALDLDESKTDLANNVMYFYPAGQTRGSQKYQLADSVEYYVNGVEMGIFDEAAYKAYVLDTTNTITLQKETETGSTISSDYNVIMITKYATAVVDEVTEKTDYIQVNFDESEVSPTRIRFYTDDEDYTYSITMDGKEIAATDLQEGDVLSIAYDLEVGFADSMFYTVLASRNVVESVKATTAAKDGEIKIGGETYELAKTVSESDFELSNTYTLYLDAFGRIAKVEEDASTVKLAILSSAYTKSNGDYVAELITNNGESIEAKMDDSVGVKVKAIYDAAMYDKSGNKIAKSVAYPNLVGEYKLNSSNKLTSFELVAASASSTSANEYKASSMKMGGIRLADTTAILDLSDIDAKDTFKVVAADSLIDGVGYTAFGYDKSNSGTHRFAIITDGIGGIDSTTELAVFLESGETSDDNGDTYQTMTVVVDSEEVTLTVDEDATTIDFETNEKVSLDVKDFAEGDLIVFAVNNDYVTEAYLVYENTASYDELDVTKLGDMLPSYIASIEADLCDADEDEVEIQAGILVKYDNILALAKADSIKTDDKGNIYVDLDAVVDLTTNGTTVYSYNWSNSSKYFGRVVVDDGIMASSTLKAAYDKDANRLYVTGDAAEGTQLVYAVVRTFDGDDAQEIYQIVAE